MAFLPPNFRFAYPLVLLLLLSIPALALWTNQARVRRPATLRYADVTMVREFSQSWRVRGRLVLKLLRWLSLALLIVAIARPQTGDARQVVRGEGVDIALALDISSSMASLDFQPDNRLVASKNVITEFVSEREFDRIGLVVFANEAFSQAPLTVDHDVLVRLLQNVNFARDLGLSDGTAIGMGIATAANMLKDSSAESRIIILLTDGVNTAGQIDPFTAAQAAKTLGIRVYTIGAGKPGQVAVPVPNIFGEETISYAESVIDEATLATIAEETGGLFFRATDTNGLREIYNSINELEKSDVEIETFTRYDELAQWILIPALALMVLEMLLRKTVFRKIP
ncbi:MAG: vWA domain-containing protein [Candidatus Promineifilaceae bacterium]